MKMSLKICLVIFFVPLACASSKTVPAQNFQDTIYQKWMHSYEEDQAEVKVYRPTSFNFPPSRGRTGFEIKENGDFIEHGIGPTDIPVKTQGRWEMKKNSQISVNFSDEKKGYALEIISINENQLKLKRWKNCP